MRLSAVLLFLSACGGSGSLAKREPDEYVGCATDENWALFDDVADIVDDTQAPMIVSPADGATVGNTPIDITWQNTPTITGQTAGDVPMTCPQWSQGYSTLHLPPISGTVFDLQVVQGGQVVHRVLTTLEKWTASADTWQKLAGSSIELQMHRIVVLNNDRKEGPYAQSAAWKLTISK